MTQPSLGAARPDTPARRESPHRRTYRTFAALAAVAASCLVAAQSAFAAPPSADFEISSPVPEIGQSVTFTPTVNDPDEAEHTYAWDFGDGATSTAQSPSHAYSSAGTKSVTLVVTRASGKQVGDPVTKTLRVNTRPVAVVSCGAAAVPPNQPLSCSGSASSDAEGGLAYAWDVDGDGFDDGGDVTETFSFAAEGARTIRLRVTDGDGVSEVAESEVTVTTIAAAASLNALPSAAFVAVPESPRAGEAVTLFSTSSDADGPITEQDWDLDDDGRFDDASGPLAKTAFASAGVHRVRLRVVDSKGATSSASQTIAVLARALPTLLMRAEIGGRLLPRATRVTRLFIRVSRGTHVTARCLPPARRSRTGGCPKPISLTPKDGTARLRRLERRFAAGTKIVIAARRDGYVGRYVSYTMRAGRQPLRRDRCLVPGLERPSRCASE